MPMLLPCEVNTSFDCPHHKEECQLDQFGSTVTAVFTPGRGTHGGHVMEDLGV